MHPQYRGVRGLEEVGKTRLGGHGRDSRGMRRKGCRPWSGDVENL